MNITKVYFDRATTEEVAKNKRLVGYADIVINHDFVIHDIAVLRGLTGEYIIFPQNWKGKSVAFPVTDEVRVQMLDAILQKMNEEDDNGR